MKIFVVACFVLVASASAGFIAPSAGVARQRRDVSELPAYSYLPPQLKMAEEAEEPQAESTTAAVVVEEMTEEPSSAALGENGYEYRTVRRLKYRYRTRRDVSHLAQQYLPPSNEYLPPSKPQDDSETVQAAIPKVANEYLPPNQPEEEEAVVSTEAPAVAEEPTEAAATAEEPAQDTAVLAKDGYHYKQPIVIEEMEQVPQEPQEEELMPEEDAALKMGNLNAEYLPPQEGEAVIVEEVAPEETAVLAKDGYHYRAVRRFRL